MADTDTITRIDAFVAANNGDVSLRRGSLSQDENPADASWSGEIGTSNFDFTASHATLGEVLDDLDAQLGRIGGS